MATIKSYSDLQQSKKLAEILPLESADMMYQEYETVIGDDYGYDYIIRPFFSSDIDGISCWSLAALLSVIPCSYKVYRHPYDDGLSLSLEISNCIEVAADNEVDACYEMIIKLHELNLL